MADMGAFLNRLVARQNASGSPAVPVELVLGGESGTIGEYSWNSAETPPTPTETAGIVVGMEVDTKKVYMYDFYASDWVEWMAF